MSTFTLSATLTRPYDDAVEAVRAALGAHAFGVLRLTAALAALAQED
jgi:hypothetical protein